MTPDLFQSRWGGHVPSLAGRRYRCAVLCPLLERDGQTQILLEVRAASLTRQPGEVCFPGGKANPGEEAAVCALRETQEELGIAPEHISLLGQPDFLCHPSGFLLQPVLGLIHPAGLAQLRPSPDEVAEVFTVPFSFFMDTPPQLWSYALEARVPAEFPYEALGIRRDYPWGHGSVDVPIWQYQGHAIWGLTARILRDLVLHLKTS